MKPSPPQITFKFNNQASSYTSIPEAAHPSNSTESMTLELVRVLAETDMAPPASARKLAVHLAEDERARSTWPGNMFFSFFGNLSDQADLRPPSLRALACIAEAVLIQIDDMHAVADSPAVELTAEEKLQLPGLRHLDRLGLNQVDGFPEIFFDQMQCDCLDWQTIRRKLAADSPGRLCKHLSRLIHLQIERCPEIGPVLRRLIDWAGEMTRALPPHREWRLLVDEPDPIIAAWGGGTTCSIFANSKEGKLTLFTYDLGAREWRDHERPLQIEAGALRDCLAEIIGGHV